LFLQTSFQFLVDKPIIFQSFSGFAVRGIFYELLKKVNLDLSNKLHEGKKLAPFSCTPLLSGNKKKIIWKSVSPFSRTFFQITLLDKDVCLEWQNLLIKGINSINLLTNEFPVIEVGLRVIDPNQLIQSKKPVRSFKISFITPTFFRVSPKLCYICKKSINENILKLLTLTKPPYHFTPLPHPEFLFRSLVRLWSNFSNIKLNIDIIEFLDWLDRGGVVVSAFPNGIRTCRFFEHPTTNKWIVGFTGTVHYNLLNSLYDKKYAEIVDVLLKFGEFTNVGGGRTAGFGMIKYEPQKE